MTWVAEGVVTTEGSGYAVAVAYLAIAGVALLVLGPLALIIARDATRHRRNAWAWGLMFLWQPVVVGVIYLIARGRPPSDRAGVVCGPEPRIREHGRSLSGDARASACVRAFERASQRRETPPFIAAIHTPACYFATRKTSMHH
jgi:hypothetical protein